MLDWKKEFDEIASLLPADEVKKGFFDAILYELQYSELRSGNGELLFEFYQQLNVKACVYCNSQHVVLLKANRRARLQADHNLPKDNYPCFAITLANLYPSCNNCNHQKGIKDTAYNLYFKDFPTRQKRFSLHMEDIADFYLNRISEKNLRIHFNQGDTYLEKVLYMTEIYANHVDYAADLLRKNKVYTKSYVSKLTSSFGSLLGNEDIINRMIFGNTLKDEDINQRVFSKLTIDLKDQLDKLKDSNS